MKVMYRLYISAIFSACLMICCLGCGNGTDVETQECLGDILDSFEGEKAYAEHLPAMPDEECEPIRTRHFRQTFGRLLNDSNYLHKQAAKTLGLEIVDGPYRAWNTKRPIVRVSSCEEYFVDTLTHSYPYLVPEAADLLQEIGHRFRDTLHARGGGEYRIRMTSALRTSGTIRRLRRINRNAVDTSAHQFGTTFDIAYNKYICDGTNHPRTANDLKNLLAEIISDLRQEGRCYVKYERKQGCFHITARQ